MRQLIRVARTTFCGAMVASPRRFLQQGGIGAVSDGPPQVFNRHVKRLQRDAAAARGDCEEHAVLRNEVAERLAERLEDTLRRFPVAADVGCGDGALLRCLHGRGGIQTLVQCDSSQNMLARCEAGVVGDISAHTVLADEEALPLASESCDLVMSNLSLHWVNDVPGTLAQIRCMLGQLAYEHEHPPIHTATSQLTKYVPGARCAPTAYFLLPCLAETRCTS